MRPTKYLLFILLFADSTTIAQIGIGTTTPEAALDITSDSNGFLMVRTSLTSNADVTTITNPQGGGLAESTLVYNDGLSGLAPAGFYYWDAAAWAPLKSNATGDIKYSFGLSDHDGWYLLNGRLISTLSTTAQNAATALGFVTTLPNAIDKFIKGKSASETMASTVGSNTVTLTQANLPNFNMSATTSSDGSHTHSGTTSSDGAHTHNYDNTTGTAFTLLNVLGTSVLTPTVTQKATTSSGSHSHTLSVASAGAHTHSVTVNSGGSATALSLVPSSIAANVFVYLGK